MTTRPRHIDRRTTIGILAVSLLAAPIALHAYHAAEPRPYDPRLGVEELRDLRAAIIASMPHTVQTAPADALWYGMDLRHEPADRITMRIPPYDDAIRDTTVDHGDTVAPGFLPRPPREGRHDGDSYMLEPIGSWDTVYYTSRRDGSQSLPKGPILMMNGVGVGRERADAMVRKAAAEVGLRFHLGPAKFTRDRDGSISLVYGFSTTDTPGMIRSDAVKVIVMKADAINGNAFMAIQLL